MVHREPFRRGLLQLVDTSGRGALALWEEIADTMNEAVFLVGPDRRLLYGNAAARRLMVIPPAQAAGRLCTDLLTCPQCQCMCRLFDEGKIEDLEVVLHVPGHPEPRVFRKNARILRSADGRIVGGVETLTDVSLEASKRALTRRRAERLLRNGAQAPALAESVVALDAELRITDASERMRELSGFGLDELRGRELRTLFDADRGLPPCTARGSDAPMSTTLLTKDGGRCAVSVSLVSTRLGDHELLAVIRPEGGEEDPVSRIERQHSFQGMVSRSAAMERLFDVLRSVADSEVRLLVEGESGTGKELVCRAVHALSGRCAQPFFPVNCATFGGSLLLSELFGHERGAFTGATTAQRGKLELAGRGTLLLDEVAEIPLEHQALLLRVLEDRRFQRIGGDTHIDLEARVIAATNRDLRTAVEAGGFRADLFHRLSVMPVRVPPLRDRVDDIALLAEYFLARIAASTERPPRALSPDAVAALEAYTWPGNVRELRNLVEYLSFTASEEIRPEHLPSHVLRTAAPPPASRERAPLRARDERSRILEALHRTRWRRAAAAELLGMERTTLWRKMRKHGIDGG